MSGRMVAGVLVAERVACLPAERFEVFVAKARGVGGPEGIAGVFADFVLACGGDQRGVEAGGRRWGETNTFGPARPIVMVEGRLWGEES